MKVAAVVTGSVLAASSGAGAVYWAAGTANSASLGQAYAFASPWASTTADASAHARTATIPMTTHSTAQLPQLGPVAPTATAARRPGKHARRLHHHAHAQPTQPSQPAVTTAYANPFRAVNGLLPERIDQGVDFGGAGPVYALGNAVVTNATASNYGWPGGGWITYKLTDGPDAGLMVFLAEDVTPTVQVGQHVTSSTVIANMFNGGDGIETGWAMADGSSAESQLPEAGGISGNGPFPTMVGLNFDELLHTLGVAPGYGWGASGSGALPPQYPTHW